MTRTKKYFILSRALGFCAIGVIALMGCQSRQEDIYVDYYTEETTAYEAYEQSNNGYVESDIQNPYIQDEGSLNYIAEDSSTLPCYRVKNGQILGSSSNVMHQANGSSNPCAFIDQKNTQKAVFEDSQVPSCPCQKKATAIVPEAIQVPSCPCQKNAAAMGQNAQCMNANNSNFPATPMGQYAGSTTNVKLPVQNNTSVNIETPARCEITKNEASIISSIPLKQDAFKLIPIDKSDPLPRFEVNGYTFKDMPLDVAIQNLVSEAGIRVYSDDALFPEVSGDNVRGELSAVIKELASAGDIFYRYDENKKQLILSRWARFTMHVPGGRIGMYTVLDALRGANITNLQPDFGSNEIYMRINTEKKQAISHLIDTIKQSPNLLLFDIQVYRMVKSPNVATLDWQKIVQDYGVTRINSSVNGIVGRVLSTGHQTTRQTLLEKLRQYGSVSLISEGVAIMPSGWKVRFDIGQCAKAQIPEQDLSMLLQSNILSKDRAESNIALDTISGEITSFHTVFGIDDTLNIIGIPGSVFNSEWKNNVEYIITLKPKMVKLIK